VRPPRPAPTRAFGSNARTTRACAWTPAARRPPGRPGEPQPATPTQAACPLSSQILPQPADLGKRPPASPVSSVLLGKSLQHPRTLPATRSGVLVEPGCGGWAGPPVAVVSLPGPEASRRPRPRANSQATKDAARPVAMSPDRGRPGECRRERPRAMKITNSGGVDPDDYRPARRRPRRRSAVRRSVTVTRYLLGVLAAPVVMAASAARRR
jgi:hypothetical protein